MTTTITEFTTTRNKATPSGVTGNARTSSIVVSSTQRPFTSTLAVGAHNQNPIANTTPSVQQTPGIFGIKLYFKLHLLTTLYTK